MHTADEAHFLGVYVRLHRVDEVIANVDVDHSTHFEHRARPQREASDAAASEADWRLSDPRRAHPDRGQGTKSGLVELADTCREIDGADIHALGECLIDQVDNELAAVADIALGV